MTHLREVLHQPAVVMVGWSLVHFLWQGVLVALVVAVVLRLNRNSSADARYAIAGTGLLVMLACPFVTYFAMSAGGVGGHESISNSGGATGFVQPVSASGGDAVPALLDRLAQLPQSFPAERLLPLLVSIWAVGVAVLALRLVLGWLQINFVRTTALPVNNNVIRARLADLSRRMNIRHPVALLESALAPGPAVIGVLKPAILFPAAALTGLWPIQIEAILAHELAHVRRHDYLVNLLQSMVETLLFYHPAVWWVSKKIRQEREHCCDDLAVQACGDRKFYATCLADLDELKPAQLALAMNAAGTGLLPRIRRILGLTGGENSAASAAAGTLLVAATGTALMVLAGTPVVHAAGQVDMIVDATPAMTFTAPDSLPVRSAVARSSEGVAQASAESAAATGPGATLSEVPSSQNRDAAETSRANGYVLPLIGAPGVSRPYQAPPPPRINVSFPDLSMNSVFGGGWLPRLNPTPLSLAQPAKFTRAKSPSARNMASDFPPVSSPVEASAKAPNSVVLPPARPVSGTTTPPSTGATKTSPRIFNYNGLLFVPDNFVLPQNPNFIIPQDNNYITPQDNNYITPQDRNYVIPDRNFIIPDRNFVAQRGQPGGASSISGGRMSTTPGSTNFVRPTQNK
jgi:beta-lactamase regulating signal transducer with metallopeptidase domain